MTKPRVLVVGDVMIDKYSFGRINRKSPEDPNVSVFDITYEHCFLGGAGNVAKNLSALGVDVDISCLANQELIRLFDEWSIGFEQWSAATEEVIQKNRIIDLNTGKQVLRLDNRIRCEERDLSNYENLMMRNFYKTDCYDAIIFSDYNKGIVTEKVVNLLRNQYSGHIFVDTKSPHLDCWKSNNMTIKINSHEFDQLIEKMMLKGDRSELNSLVITFGELGCIYYKNGKQVKRETTTPIYDASRDVIGAGDCFLAGLVKKWLETKSISKSLSFANKVATKSVQKSGTSTVTLEEVSE